MQLVVVKFVIVANEVELKTSVALWKQVRGTVSGSGINDSCVACRESGEVTANDTSDNFS